EEAVALVEEEWRRGLPEDCDVVIGVTVTRLEARPVEIAPGLIVPQQTEKIALRIRGRGGGRPAAGANSRGAAGPFEQPLLPFAPDPDAPGARERDFALVRSLIFASAAFPVAFAPVPMSLCLTEPSTSTTAAPTCPGKVETMPFLDGGVFDNNPLRF